MRRASITLLSLSTLVWMGAMTVTLAQPRASARVSPPPATEQTAPRAYTGPGSCAAAACHGAIRSVAGSRILQTEYTTWISRDRHARAVQVLSTPVSVRMASILGLPAAHSAPKCLACHSVAAPDAQLARSFISEGVSCESCH